MTKIINFSVILPTFNRGKVLFKTVESVINQTYGNFELLIIDDGSTDNTQDILKQFNDKRIKYFKNSHSGLPAVPRNFGIKNSTYEWICFLDSDDLWYPKKLEIVRNSILNHDDILLFCHNEILVKNNSKSFIKHSVELSSNFYRQLLIHGNKLSPSAVCLNKNYLLVNKIFFNENINFKIIEDYDFWLRFFQSHNQIKFINHTLSEYILLNDSISNNTLLYIKNLENLYRKHVYQIQNFTDDKDELMNTLLVNILPMKMKYHIKNFNIYKLIITLLKLISKDPSFLFKKIYTKINNGMRNN